MTDSFFSINASFDALSVFGCSAGATVNGEVFPTSNGRDGFRRLIADVNLTVLETGIDYIQDAAGEYDCYKEQVVVSGLSQNVRGFGFFTFNEFFKTSDSVLGPEDCFSLEGDDDEVEDGETRGRRRRELSDTGTVYMF